MLRIFTPPFSLRSGNDVVGPRTAEMFRSGGVEAKHQETCPDWIAGLLNSGKIPLGRRIYRRLVMPASATVAARSVAEGDRAWFLEPAIPLSGSTRIEESIKRRGARYIFHVMDDWFSIPYLKDRTVRLCRLADLVVVPTPALLDRVQEMAPGTRVVQLEEPIDVDRVRPLRPTRSPDLPVVIWCGGPLNMRFLDIIQAPLEQAAREIPFQLRIVSGLEPRGLALEVDWEWKKYDYQHESELLAGGVCGLAPLEDYPYARCKGAYKIKTYFAAGLPVIASPVGYQNQLVSDGENGFFCQSADEWTDCLLELLRNQAGAARLSCNARKAAENLYSHNAVCKSWCDAIEFLQ